MTLHKCPSRDELRHWLAGQLDDLIGDNLAVHTAGCDACDQILDQLEKVAFEYPTPILGPSDLTPQESSNVQAVVAIATGVLLYPSKSHPSWQDQTLQAAGEDWVGRRLGDYEIICVIGRGGMGLVFQARQVALDRIVALKVIRPEHGEREHFLRRFRREMIATGQLSHPNLIRAYDAGVIDGLPYLTTEYIEGPSPNTLLSNDRRLKLGVAAEIIRQAAWGLHHAHQAGWIHRDVKLSNLIIGCDEAGFAQIKVLDLGLASGVLDETAGLTQSAELLGTLRYVSPEQARGESELDARTDVYGLGVALVRLLTGDFPPMSRRHREELPKAVVDLIDESLATDRDERLATASEMAHRLNPLATPFSAADVRQASMAIYNETYPSDNKTGNRKNRKAPSKMGPFGKALTVFLLGGALTLGVAVWINRHSRPSPMPTIANTDAASTSESGTASMQRLHPLLPVDRVVEVPVRGRRRDPEISRLYFEASEGPMTLRLSDPLNKILGSEAVLLYFYANGDSSELDPETGHRISRPHQKITMPDVAESTYNVPPGTSKFSVVPAMKRVIDGVGIAEPISRAHTICTFYCYPDLTAGETTLGRSSLHAGSSIEFETKIANTGSLASNAGHVSVRLESSDDVLSAPIGRMDYPSLLSGESQTLSFRWQSPPTIPVGEYRLRIKVDAGETTLERDELQPGHWDTHLGQPFYFVGDPRGSVPSDNEAVLSLWFEAASE